MSIVEIPQEEIRQPLPPGPLKWVKGNLFNNVGNTLITLILLPLIFFAIVNAIIWIVTQADWTPVINFPLLYAVGQYPRDQIWRVGVSLSLIIFMLGVSWGKWGGLLRSISIAVGLTFLLLALLPIQHAQLNLNMRLYLGSNLIWVLLGFGIGRAPFVKVLYIVLGWLLVPVISILLLAGFENSSFLPQIATTLWGGLLVTFLLSAGGILLSFPIGVALALGRRSSLPVVSAFSTIFIEGVRGVPLITILFMFSIILALFLPAESRIDRLLRALMAVTVFSAAYTAENVRGGLQAVPKGQIEAAKAVGMNGLQTMVFIVLPQAIRAVIPAIVGQFISLFKDTTLVVIVGINDFLGIGRSIINSDPEFVQLQLEVYLFIAVVYWIFSYLMSLASRRLETALGVSAKL
ncbi:MAG TPA: amino acid ABC transporter permease [Chloroflexi bacterium]|nr:amino acid ABC transporter permease [Chloroflexota bacterium]HBY07782.1 amino acid ABC transporter permease [Chloroflexota bacterium]